MVTVVRESVQGFQRVATRRGVLILRLLVGQCAHNCGHVGGGPVRVPVLVAGLKLGVLFANFI